MVRRVAVKVKYGKVLFISVWWPIPLRLGICSANSGTHNNKIFEFPPYAISMKMVLVSLTLNYAHYNRTMTEPVYVM